MKLLKLLSFVIVLLVVTNITLSNHSLDDSKKLSDLNSEVNALTHEITILRSTLAEAGSLSAISGKVEAAGFTDTPKVVSLSVGYSVASR